MSTVIDYKAIEKQFELDNTIFSEDSDIMVEMVTRINKLKSFDRIIFLMYVEMQSYQKVAELLKCSKSLIQQRINSIRKELGYKQ